jgi:hypothetical protein
MHEQNWTDVYGLRRGVAVLIQPRLLCIYVVYYTIV